MFFLYKVELYNRLGRSSRKGTSHDKRGHRVHKSGGLRKMIQRVKTRQIFIRDIPIGGDAPIPVQSMTYSKTYDVKETLEQINRLYFAGCDIVRVSVPTTKDANALKEIVRESPLPVVADIHFNHRLALKAAEVVDCIRINPGNIGGKDKIREVVKACNEPHGRAGYEQPRLCSPEAVEVSSEEDKDQQNYS